jgi:hypothetical protein
MGIVQVPAVALQSAWLMHVSIVIHPLKVLLHSWREVGAAPTH